MKRPLVVLLFLFLCLPQAAACGGGFLTALLFRAYPEAEQVFLAEDRARTDGLLEGPAVPETDLVALHEWRARSVAAAVARFETRFREINPDMPDNRSVYIFLIHEFQWLEISASEGGPVMTMRPHSPDGPALRLFTTHAVLAGLVDGTIDWDKAIERKLITARDGSGERRAWFAALREVTDSRTTEIR